MSKREKILKSAARLFASQGFDGTTTIQIAKEAGVTEPLIFYHFKGKDELFTRIIGGIFSEYFTRLDVLEQNEAPPFAGIQNLIDLQFDIVEEFPDEIYIISTRRPVRFHDEGDAYVSSVRTYRRRMDDFLTGCITAGIESGEFHSVPVVSTANLITAMLNGILLFKVTRSDEGNQMRQAAIDFCRRSLINE